MSNAAGAAGAGAGVDLVVEATSESHFNSILEGSRDRLVTVFFWEDFHEASRRGGQMDMVVTQLARAHPDVKFVKVQAEGVPEVSEKFDIAAVPTFVFLAGGTFLGKQEGANAPMLAQDVVKFKSRSGVATAAPVASAEEDEKALNERLTKLINKAHVMVFMKGTPQEAKCKFSRKVVGLLTTAGVTFSAFNILNDDAVRQGLKKFSSWPTFPQIYVAGKLVGGHDILVEMVSEDPTLASLRAPNTSTETLETRLQALVSRAPVMLFMKGSPQEPRCGFSRQAVSLLTRNAITFDSFDILSDNTVRQGLKKFSNWPTYPQLYVKGQLIGGLDILKQMEEDAEGDLASELGIDAAVPLNERLAKLIRQSRVVLFMKGHPDEPRCGFSRQAVALLREAGVTFTHFDILGDNDVRQGLKTFSNWPTYPQLYVDGNLIGGLDIMKELHEEEELAAFGSA